MEISGIQRGNIVTLTWLVPSGKVSDKSVLDVARADVYRLAKPLDSPSTVSEEEFASRSVLIAALPVSATKLTERQMTFTDTLEFANQAARLYYAVRFVNGSGQKAIFSNFLLIQPTTNVAQNPENLSAQVSEKFISLNWQPPKENINGTKPVNIVGYNIYRIENETAKLLNNSPITNDSFNDKLFEFGKEYRYFVRAVSLGSDGEPVESLDSNKIEITPKDVFAPSPPGAITIAAAPKNLSIFFAVNTEPDILGYKIYRSTKPDQPKSEWQLLTPEPLTRNTFQDFKVEAGKTYYYYLTAVDKSGNVSEPSEIVSETAP